MVEKSLWCCTGRIYWKSALWYLQELYPVECPEMLFVHRECLVGGTVLQDNLRRLLGTFLATGCYKLSCTGGPGQWGSHGAGEAGMLQKLPELQEPGSGEAAHITETCCKRPLESGRKTPFPAMSP